MAQFDSIVVLTGAGISAESGIATFRDKGGLWSTVDIEDVATPEAFDRNPHRVLDFYNARRRGMGAVRPNAAHEALARLDREHRGAFLLVTQNIDGLHEMAGSRRLLHMHGEIGSGETARALCNACGARADVAGDLTTEHRCPACNEAGRLRPDVVWFGEMPYGMDTIQTALARCNLFVSIGTSGNVYPAAGFVEQAHFVGAHTVELNLEPSAGARLFAEALHGPATHIVPAFVDRVLQGRVPRQR
jgi:NAD-dependent deacetylase